MSVSILALLLMMGLKGELNLLSLREYKLSLKYRGYSYRQLGWTLADRHFDNPGHVAALGKKFASDLPHFEKFAFYHGLSAFSYPSEHPEDFQRYLWIKEFDRAYQPFFFTEMGSYWSPLEGLFSQKAEALTKFLPKEDQPYLMEGLLTSFEDALIRPDRLFRYTVGEMPKLSPENQRALAYALGKLSYRWSYQVSFLDKLKRRHTLEPLFPQELLPLYYRGIGTLLTNSYDPLSGGWPISFGRTLRKVDNTTQKLIFWGAGFEAPLLFDDPYEYERMLQEIPEGHREDFKQGLQDRFAWGGRNYWIEGKEKMRGSVLQ